MMNVKPIRTEQDYEAALSAVEPFLIMNLRRTRRKGIFEVMRLLIAEYKNIIPSSRRRR